jgi:hypothetical protein
MRKIREQRRKENLVPVEIWIPKSQRKSLRKQGYDLSAEATKAFALLIKSNKRKPAQSAEELSTEKFTKHIHIDLDNCCP